MPESQHTKKADARKPKQQLIDELRSLRRQLTAAQRKASGAHKETKENALQIKLDELSHEHALLSEIIDIAADAIISIDQNQHIVRFNQGAQHVFGYSREEIIGRSVDMLLPSQLRAAHKTYVRNFEHSDSDSRLMDRRGEIAGQRKDGTTFPARATISSVTHNGATTMTVFLRDISEIKHAEQRSKRTLEELAHVSRVNILGEISASLAHELNQPLTAILANAQAIQHQITPSAAISEEMTESISDVIDDAKRAAEVIRRLRSLSERRKYHTEIVDINMLIVETETLLRSQLIMSQLHVDLELDPTLPTVSCDPIQLQQVFLNLLTNAIDATAKRDPLDRRVLIRTSHPKSNAVEISIKDSGTGFKNEPYLNLLKPFFTTKEKGIGMGLAVSKSILQNVGGRLWAKNNRGPGATFYITLPMPAKPVAIAAARKTQELEADVLHEGTVFIVDDDVSIRKSLGRLIRSSGYAVESYASAEEFQQSEEYVGVGCILVDLHMPGASGLELQKDIKNRRCSLPLIFITGGGDTASSVRAMKEGASDFLSKPIDEKKLLDAVALATKNSRVARKQEMQHMVAQEKVGKLTPREIEVMDLVVQGLRNKQIAGTLAISEKTVKVHRGHVMQKVGARTVADLVHVAEAAVNPQAAL
ncbi:MAG: response regulator [Proteobacteria bacterium]|nr:response regulator [Pseudomonadota bacterium]